MTTGDTAGAPGASGRDVLVSMAGLIAIFGIALAVWIATAPRILLESIGEGRGVAIATGSSAAGVQLVMFAILLIGAGVAGSLLLWRRHDGLRSPRGVFLAMLNIGAMSALTAVVAGPIAEWLTSPAPDAPEGSVVALPPMVGPLYHGPLVPGASLLQWQHLPGFVSWLVLGAAAAAITLFYLVYMGTARELGSSRDEREAELERRLDAEMADEESASLDETELHPHTGGRNAAN